MNNLFKIFLCIGFSLLKNSAQSQSSSSLEFDFLQPIVYNTKNSVIDNFYSIENGNLQLTKYYGVGLYFTKLVHSKWNLHLKTGLEAMKQSYQLPYYVYFASTKTTTKIYDFDVHNYNLRLGLQKYVPLLKDRMNFKIGIDMVSRSINSKARSEIDQDVINFATSDTVLLGFNTFTPSSGGTFVLEFNTSIELNIWKNLHLHLDCTIAPRYKLGFSYDVTAVQAYTYQGKFYKNVWSDQNYSNEYIIQSIRLGLGLNWSF